MHKVLVANRGAIARRIVRTCQAQGLQSVAVFSTADAGAPHLDEATEAFSLPGHTPAETYLNQELLLDIAKRAGVDAVHPGYGFLAESASFAQSVIDAGLIFIGPKPQWLARMGDKVTARELMAAHNFPVFPGSKLIETNAQATDMASAIGYPIMVKPSGGGGGMGMFVVHGEEQLVEAVQRAKAVAASAFGNDGVYLERFIEQPRHIEYQILGDGRGNAMHMFERDCSIQRRNQKLIEESPAPGLSPEWLLQQATLAAGTCAQLGYDNLGTMETLVAKSGEVGFLEMNTRIQVEHGVTEAITGCDLIALQIELAQGGTLPSMPVREGFAMEVRLYAEDPLTLLPSTGKLQIFRPPNLFGVRVETGYREGQTISPYYDAMLAKLIAHGQTREMTIGRLLVALRAFEVVGVKTNAPLLMKILHYPAFLAGEVHTGIVEQVLGE